MEIWKDIAGFEGRYQVSDQGRVRSLPTVVTCTVQGSGDASYTIRRRGRVLKICRHPRGFLRVMLPGGLTRQIAKLVLEAFVGPCPEDYEIHHKNLDLEDCRLSNLRYGERHTNPRRVAAYRRRQEG